MRRFQATEREKIKRILLRTGIIIISLILISFLFRNQIFNLVLEKKIEHISGSYKAEIRVGKARIRGFSSILLEGISVKPSKGDTLITAGSFSATLNPFRLLLGQISMEDLMVKTLRINFVKNDSISNYQFLLESSPKRKIAVPETERGYSLQADRISRLIFSLFPSSLIVEDLNISTSTNGNLIHINTGKVSILNNALFSEIRIAEDTLSSEWILKGKLIPSDRIAGFTIHSGDKEKIVLPFLKYRWGADVRLDSVIFNISESREHDLTSVRGFASIRGLQINHPRIATVPVLFDRLSVDYKLNIYQDLHEVDSLTLITFNKITLHPWATYRAKPSKQVQLRISKPDFPAQDLFSSLPEGLFTTLSGIQTKGSLSWFLNFSLDLNQPDSLIFETSLDRRKFSVVKYGDADLYKINEEFTYTAFEKGNPVRTFSVGPENPNFRTIDKISPYLKLAVLGSEDAGFYYHRGFIPEAFRESFITNIKEKRFVRGGSTITMQLVKNVFLNRNKTISRKVEEALLVWLIENQQICTKDRMFEVYLNIIEWGPGIYGAQEAAKFYFNKDASRLTLAESIFLASIIPKPKWFRFSFEKDGSLRSSTVDFLNLLSGKMLKKNQISQQEFDKFIPIIELKGRAKQMLMKTDSIPPDTLDED